MDREDPINQFFPGEEEVDLYAVLSLSSSATSEAIKKSYYRLALIHHPDKHANSDSQTREQNAFKFQQVGFAYDVLKDGKRRERYDKTGRTDDGFEMGAGEDGWDAYFADLFDAVTKGKLDEMKREYQGSEEERQDIKAAYLETDSTIGEIMKHIPHSVFEDEARIIKIISQLIVDGELDTCKAWNQSIKDEKAKLVRKKQGEAEANEAEELAKELGVWDEFYGSGKVGARKGKGKASSKETQDEEGDTSALQALILKRKKNAGNIFDSIAAKYSEDNQAPKRKGGKKRGREDGDTAGPKKSRVSPPEIDDEEFERLQQKLFGEKKAAEESPKKGPAKRGKGKKAV